MVFTIRVEVSDEQMDALQHLADADEVAFRQFSRPRALSCIIYAQWRRNLSCL